MNSKEIQEKINNKTKPLGALGKLEKLAMQIALIQNTDSPAISKPTIVVFAADHGIAKEGVSAYPQEVTAQMVLNFLSGGAAINVFSRLHGIELLIVDAGVASDLPPHDQLWVQKIERATKNMLKEPAMSIDTVHENITLGQNLVRNIASKGCNCIGFGEMGIGNTSSASLLMHFMAKIPLELCVGMGTASQSEHQSKKLSVLEKVAQKYAPQTPFEALSVVGGHEIAQMCGAMIEAYNCGMVVLIDGFIATTAYLVAASIEPKIESNAIFCHQSDENGHKYLLEYLKKEPLLNLNMRLGEGTGCAVALPIIKCAVAFLNEMASFDSAGVSKEN